MVEIRLSCQEETWPDGTKIEYGTSVDNLSVRIFGDPKNPAMYMRCVEVCPVGHHMELSTIRKKQADLLLAIGVDYYTSPLEEAIVLDEALVRAADIDVHDLDRLFDEIDKNEH